MEVQIKDLLETAAHYALLTELAEAIFKGEGMQIVDGQVVSDSIEVEDAEALCLLVQSLSNVLKNLKIDNIDVNNLEQELPNIHPCNKPRVMGYGIMAEYCRLDNRPHEINQWERRFNDALNGKN
ncbi:MAG: hypothetical protein FWF56_00565 [Firmicutes bacterium]|nr:hypothetical protein [Bacillota bacterium]MCL1954079.1 hypothetical protein [Bacillota bacterium]